MSPAATPPATREVKAEGPRGGGRVVKITPSGRGNKATIRVDWVCGVGRTFTIDQLRQNIELADGPGTKHPMWLNPKDRTGGKFFIRVTDGKLTANERMAENGTVDWVDLKRELQAVIADVLS